VRPNKRDVYVAARSLAGHLKASLHESGSWSVSHIDTDRNREEIDKRGNRHLDVWTRPPEFGPGWTRALRILVPGTDLRTWEQKQHPKTIYADPPAKGHWIWIDVLLGNSERPSRLTWESGMLIGTIDLGEGHSVHVLAQQARPTPVLAQSVAGWRSQWLRQVVRDPEKLRLALTHPGARMLLGAQDDNQTRIWVDLAASLPRPRTVPICTGLGQLLQIDTQPE
jgi:hypothetical protein